jgi:hypothetical protein
MLHLNLELDVKTALPLMAALAGSSTLQHIEITLGLILNKIGELFEMHVLCVLYMS